MTMTMSLFEKASLKRWVIATAFVTATGCSGAGDGDDEDGQMDSSQDTETNGSGTEAETGDSGTDAGAGGTGTGSGGNETSSGTSNDTYPCGYEPPDGPHDSVPPQDPDDPEIIEACTTLCDAMASVRDCAIPSETCVEACKMRACMICPDTLAPLVNCTAEFFDAEACTCGPDGPQCPTPDDCSREQSATYACGG